MAREIDSPARRARARADRIRAGIRQYITTLADIFTAWQEGDWDALGYDSWETYIDGEFGASRLAGLTEEMRLKALEELRLLDMPQRAIAAVVGMSQSSVSRALAGRDSAESDEHLSPQVDEPREPASKGPLDASGSSEEKLHPPMAQPSPAMESPREEPREDRPRPAPWDPAERAEHEKAVRRRQDIEAAHRFASRIVSELRSSVLTIIAGVRYGEPGLVTKEMVTELREAVDMLEREL